MMRQSADSLRVCRIPSSSTKRFTVILFVLVLLMVLGPSLVSAESKMPVTYEVICHLNLDDSITYIHIISIANVDTTPKYRGQKEPLGMLFYEISKDGTSPVTSFAVHNSSFGVYDFQSSEYTFRDYSEYEEWSKNNPKGTIGDFLRPCEYTVKKECYSTDRQQLMYVYTLYYNFNQVIEPRKTDLYKISYSVKDRILENMDGKVCIIPGTDMNITFGENAEKETMRVRLDLPQDPYHWSELTWIHPIPDRVLSHGRSESYIWEYNFSQTTQTQGIELHYIVHRDFYKISLDAIIGVSVVLALLSIFLGFRSFQLAKEEVEIRSYLKEQIEKLERIDSNLGKINEYLKNLLKPKGKRKSP